MIVLLVVVLIAIVLYGYLLIKRLDNYIEQGFLLKEPETSGEKEILLYGETEIIDIIVRALDAVGITYDFATEPMIKEEVTYQWIGAFSEDDMNNLIICASGKRKYDDIHTMAKCNNTIYKNVFKQIGINVIMENNISVSQILTCLRGRGENDISKKN